MEFTHSAKKGRGQKCNSIWASISHSWKWVLKLQGLSLLLSHRCLLGLSFSASHRNCPEYAQVTNSVLNMALVWTLDDLSHMQVFIIDGPLGAWCDKEREGSLKIAWTPTIISFNINYSPVIRSDRRWAKTKMQKMLWNKREGKVWIMDFQSGRGERCILSAQQQNTFCPNKQADHIRVATFQGQSACLLLSSGGKSLMLSIYSICLALPWKHASLPERGTAVP